MWLSGVYNSDDTAVLLKYSATDMGVILDSLLKYHQRGASAVQKASIVTRSFLKVMPVVMLLLRSSLHYSSTVGA